MTNVLLTYLSRLSLRTKIIAAAVLALLLGMMLRGGGGDNGRFLPIGSTPEYIIDTQKGTTWRLENGTYRRVASMPWRH
jgi:hypothetical protein